MYLKSSKNIDVNRYELEIEVSPEEFKQIRTLNDVVDAVYGLL